MNTLASNLIVTPTQEPRLDQVDMNKIPFGRVFSDHMLVADFKQAEWQTPEIRPYGPLPFQPSLMALHYGQSIFEGMKAFRGVDGNIRLFRPDANFKRMNRSARRMCMPEIPASIFIEGIKSLINLDKGWVPSLAQGSLYLRPLYFASDEFIGVSPSNDYTFTTFTCPVGPYYSKPVNLLVNKDFVRATPGGVGSAKTAGNYAAALLPDRLAKQQGYDNILWLDSKELTYIEECGTMNVFFVIDGTVITSPLTGTILPGITRDSVIRLLRDNGYKLEIRRLSIQEVESAYEEGTLEDAFGAGTAATIAPIAKIGYSGKDMVIPKDPAERPISAWLKNTLSKMKSGEAEDPYGWIVPLS